jgi:hypothetical protein
MNSKLVSLVLILICVRGAAQSQTGAAAKGQEPEQTVFGAEALPGEALVKKPVEIPNGVLQILRDNLYRGTINCIKNVNGLEPQQVPASWFMASEIHLDGAGEIDLIVRPGDLMQSPSPNRWLFGAHAVPFWIVGNTGGKYELLLNTVADGLRVLDSRTNGYRDIEIGSLTAVSLTTLTLKFDGHHYQLSETKRESN